MVEIIRALTDSVDKIGLAAVVVMCSIGVAAFTGWCYKTLVDKVVLLQGTTIRENTEAMRANTTSVQELSEYMSGFGSDPTKLCKAMELREHIRDLEQQVEQLRNPGPIPKRA